MSRATRFAIVAGMALVGCTKERTELVLVVDVEELGVPCDVDALSIEVRGPTAAPVSTVDVDLVDTSLPGSLTVVSDGASTANVTVRGFLDGSEIARVRSSATFEEGRTLLWPVVIGPGCALPEGCDQDATGLVPFESLPEPRARRDCACVPREETCNAADDDCDASIDEGLLERVETCGACDVSCDAATELCDGSSGVPTCRARRVDRYCVEEGVATPVLNACDEVGRTVIAPLGSGHCEPTAVCASECPPGSGEIPVCSGCIGCGAEAVDDLGFELYGEPVTASELFIGAAGVLWASDPMRSVVVEPGSIEAAPGRAVLPFWEYLLDVGVFGLPSRICHIRNGNELRITWEHYYLQPFDPGQNLTFTAILQDADPDRVIVQYDTMSVGGSEALVARAEGISAVIGVKNDVPAACPPDRCDSHGQCDGDIATPCGYTAFAHHERVEGGLVGKQLVFTPCLEGLPCPCGSDG